MTEPGKGDAVPVCCPYCGVVLDPPPEDTQECPACCGTVHLETVAGTSHRCLMTDADVDENDKAWERCDLRAHRRLG
jgi:hypothetical protein